MLALRYNYILRLFLNTFFLLNVLICWYIYPTPFGVKKSNPTQIGLSYTNKQFFFYKR